MKSKANPKAKEAQELEIFRHPFEGLKNKYKLNLLQCVCPHV